jgi:hypothetical protein
LLLKLNPGSYNTYFLSGAGFLVAASFLGWGLTSKRPATVPQHFYGFLPEYGDEGDARDE